jgi:hypothetical protein
VKPVYAGKACVQADAAAFSSESLLLDLIRGRNRFKRENASIKQQKPRF